MKGRALVVVLALILATVATAGVFLYARGVQEQAKAGGDMVSVIVSKVDIPSSTDLNELLKDGDFKVIQVPEAAKVDGAITSVDQLRDQHNSVAILAGEQIPLRRIEGEVPGGPFSIPEGMEAITVSLDAPRAVAGGINVGDQVVVYSTFKNVPDKSRSGGSTLSASSTQTTVLVPQTRVLAVLRPVAGSGFGSESEQPGDQIPGSVVVTLALTPEDSQRLVFSMETGTVWFGLLPPHATGESLKPVSYVQVVK
jgi:pilus assembly protein CpaB